MNKKALALIAGGLVLLALIIYFVFFYNFNKKTENTNEPTGQNTTAEPVVSKPTTPATNATPRSAEEQSRDSANQLAIYFGERYGTSSTQADFSNLTELEIFMTDAMRDRTRAFVAAERKKVNGAPEYQSVVTQAILVNFVTFSDSSGTAEGTVKTKRQETDAAGKVNSKDQDLSVVLKKVGGEWKVDQATWK